ncbi:MAG: tetratricopeptide repeat protein, partial [Candidatus Omnitrophica bacterium]|nr:tetratricopeptide repeat protein [Candidatus Omnitrophota bacterium]
IKRFPTHQSSEDAAFKLGEAELNLQSYESTIDYFRKYIIRFPQSTRLPEAYFFIGEAYYYLEDYLDAVTYYAKAAEKSYENRLTLMSKVSLGWSYLKLEKFLLAEKYFTEAFEFADEKNIMTDDIYLGQATLYSEMGDQRKALEAYTYLIQQFPDSARIAEARLGQANIYYLLHDYPKAILSYERLIENLSEQTEREDVIEKAYFGLAWAYLKAGDIDEAVANFEKIKNKTKSTTVKISALTQIGDAYQDMNELEKAVEIYDGILKEYPDSAYVDYVQYRQGVALLKMDEISAATLASQNLKVNFPESRYLNDIKYYLAVAYFKKQDWAVAREQIMLFLDTLSESSEFHAEAYYILGLSHFHLGDYRKAISVFENILADYPEQKAIGRNAEFHIAKSYYKMNSPEEAIERMKTIITKYAASEIALNALVWLGDYYLQAANYDEAIKSYENCIEVFPDNDQIDMVYYELSQAYRAKDDLEKAVGILDNIDRERNRELYAKAKLLAAEIFSQKLESEAAVETYQKIISSSPDFRRDAYVKLAEVYLKNQNYKDAVAIYKKALKTEPKYSDTKDVEIQFLLADAYELWNKEDAAIEEYLKIPYLYSKNTDWVIKSYLRIARIFENQENWVEAKKVYEKIIPYKTDQAKFARERLEWIQAHVSN